MDMSIADYHFWTLLSIQLIGFAIVVFKVFLNSYTSEKGKNLATKQDIGEITQIIESTKSSLTIKIEEVKSDLSYKNEHLIHLRAAERLAIVGYYKATWVLILNITRTDLIKQEIDDFVRYPNMPIIPTPMAIRYISESELILNNLKEEVLNLKYLRDVSESELRFFYDKPELRSIISELNLSLSQFERALFRSINSLLQVSSEATIKINNGQLTNDLIEEIQRKRSDILASWYDERRNSFDFIITFNENLKLMLHNRLMSLTS
jgi:hypothetical protein